MLRTKVKTGLECFLRDPSILPVGMRVGLLCNAASVDSNLNHAAGLLFKHQGINLKVLFGPQHGMFTTCQDNMIESPHAVDSTTGLKIYSLYSETRGPTAEMLSEIDCLLVDLQDVGCRVYTYIWTLSLAMEACAEAHIPVWVLDRPNPIADLVQGNPLEPGYESFIGRCGIPMRHGLTIAEFASFFKSVKNLNCELNIVKMENYNRDEYFEETGLPWIMTSPNMSTLDTVRVYPGMVLLEGTNISEGRGTVRPFEIFGAPFVDSRKLCGELNSLGLEGVLFRPLQFEPVFHKFKGELCGGAQVHVTNVKKIRPYLCGLYLLSVLKHLYPGEFAWRSPPYEYEFENMPIDILTGSPSIRKAVDGGESIKELEEKWQPELKEYKELRKEIMIY